MRSLILLVLVAVPAFAEEKPAQPTALVQGNTAFAADLYAKLSSSKGNLFFSPYSISSALGMAWGGARGATAKEMAKALHFGPEAEVHPGFESLNKSLIGQDKPGYQLSVANKLYVQKGFKLLDAYLALTRDRYGAPIAQLDLGLDASRVEINTWVEQQTHDRIKNLIPAGILSPNSRLVLVNAVYFKGAWFRPFDVALTRPAPFTSGGKPFDVPMMNKKGLSASYAEVDGVQLLGLDYTGGDVSMLIALPKEPDGLGALEKRFDAAKVETWAQALKPQAVDVALPKFHIEQSFDLVPTLSALGMKSAFQTSADFSGIDGKPDLFISAAVHKAFVDVTEAGTEAAAATGIAMATRAMRPVQNPVFRADHPFLFMLRDRQTGTVLFLGRVVDPR